MPKGAEEMMDHAASASYAAKGLSPEAVER